MRIMIPAALTLVALAGCGKKEATPADTMTAEAPASTTTAAPTTATPGATTAAPTAYAGRYTGVVDGADVALTLKDGNSYERTTFANGKTDKVTGTFTWDAANASILVLDAQGGGAKYQVAEGGVHVLGADGKSAGTLAKR